MSEVETDLTTAQRKLLLHQMLYPADASHNLASVLRITGDVDVERLRQALLRLVNASSSFNTVFVERGGRFRAVRDPTRSYTGEVIRMAGDASSWVVQHAARLVDRPFPPGQWPLYTGNLIQDDHAVYFTLAASHLVADAYTFYNLPAVLERLYADPEAEPSGLHLDPSCFPPRRQTSPETVDFFRSMIGHLPSLGAEQLPGKRNGNGVLTGGQARLRADRSLIASIDEAVATYGHRKFAFFVAAHMLLLGALSGGKTVVTHVPMPNRRGREQVKAFGYFVNVLPLAVDLGRYETFLDLWQEIEKTVYVFIRNQDFDFSAHTAEVFGSSTPMLLQMSNSITYYKDAFSFHLPGCRIETLPVERKQVICPLVVQVEDHDDDCVLHVAYADDLAESRPQECLLTIVRTVAENPRIPLRQVRALSAEEQLRIDDLVNARRSYSTPDSLHTWFEQQAAEHPQRVAVQDGTEIRTYAELNRQANRIARRLRQTTTGDYVAVAMHRGCDLIAVLLGILKAGKAYVPLDPNAPDTRIRHILAQFGELPLIAADDIFPGLGHEPRIDLSRLAADSAQESGDDLPDGDDRRRSPAYVIFTSGSTGMPKGVQVTHENVMRLFRCVEEVYDFGAEDTWCLFHSYAFDFSVWEMFGALLHGGRLVIVPETVGRSPAEFLDFLCDHGVTVLCQTPSAFRQLSRVLTSGHGDRLRVRYVIFGGEVLRFEFLGRWLDVMGERAALINMYGITETTVHSTYYRITPEDIRTLRDSVIGKPLGDLGIHVVDADLRPCPVGVPGEILISGPGVSLGYLNQPELTAARFVHGVAPGRVSYRSGDLARVRPDGNLVYLGRIDQQVQLRGYRIELGEIEAALLTVPGVQECAVRLDEREGAAPRLVAYLAESVPVDDRQLRIALRALLPPYMVPSRYMRLEAIPLTVNHKVDDAALPPFRDDVMTLTQYEDISDDTVGRVTRVWREVLGVGDFGPDDRFFDIGGNSMHVTEVYERLLRTFGVTELQMIDLFEYTSVRELAGHIELLMAAHAPAREPVAAG